MWICVMECKRQKGAAFTYDLGDIAPEYCHKV
jgi:hypothetical protein